MRLWEALDSTQADSLKPKSYDRIEPGTYFATISDIEIKESPLDVKVSVEYTIEKDNEGKTEYKGRKVWFNFTLDEKTSPKKMAFIKAQILKVACVDSTNGDPVGTLLGAKGKTGTIEIQYREYNGKYYPNVYALEFSPF